MSFVPDTTQEPARGPDGTTAAAVVQRMNQAAHLDRVLEAALPNGTTVKIIWWNGATECEVRVCGDTVDLHRLARALDLAVLLVNDLNISAAARDHAAAPVDDDDTQF